MTTSSPSLKNLRTSPLPPSGTSTLPPCDNSNRDHRLPSSCTELEGGEGPGLPLNMSLYENGGEDWGCAVKEVRRRMCQCKTRALVHARVTHPCVSTSRMGRVGGVGELMTNAHWSADGASSQKVSSSQIASVNRMVCHLLRQTPIPKTHTRPSFPSLL